MLYVFLLCQAWHSRRAVAWLGGLVVSGWSLCPVTSGKFRNVTRRHALNQSDSHGHQISTYSKEQAVQTHHPILLSCTQRTLLSTHKYTQWYISSAVLGSQLWGLTANDWLFQPKHKHYAIRVQRKGCVWGYVGGNCLTKLSLSISSL